MGVSMYLYCYLDKKDTWKSHLTSLLYASFLYATRLVTLTVDNTVDIKPLFIVGLSCERGEVDDEIVGYLIFKIGSYINNHFLLSL